MHREIRDVIGVARVTELEVVVGRPRKSAVDRLARLNAAGSGRQVTTGAVLLVCDKVLHKLGHVTQVQQALADASFSVDVFDDVEGEPDSATARTLARSYVPCDA